MSSATVTVAQPPSMQIRDLSIHSCPEYCIRHCIGLNHWGTTESVIADLKRYMGGHIVSPVKAFGCADDLLREYKDQYWCKSFRGDIRRVAQTYLDSVTVADAEGRYFGRSPAELAARYSGDKAAAVRDFLIFVGKFGFFLKDPQELTPSGDSTPECVEDLYEKLIRSQGPEHYLVGPEWTARLFGILTPLMTMADELETSSDACRMGELYREMTEELHKVEAFLKG